MIDPLNPPSLPEATDKQLEEFLLFSIAVAGHNAIGTAAAVERFIKGLTKPGNDSLFDLIATFASQYGMDQLAASIQRAGLGCYSQRARSFLELAKAGLDLRACQPSELETVFGIGKKTSRFFVMYTRPAASQWAVLDVHILRWLQEQGHDVPSTTPRGKRYDEIEGIFLEEARQRGLTTLELDKQIWQDAYMVTPR
jgi:thermostable 8-oxoguanine DNA glycosylase